MQKIITGMSIYLLCSFSFRARAQLSLTGELRVRSEYRNGYGTLETVGATPAFVTSQRARLNFHYVSSRVIFHASVQDVRVWGADASTINNADGARLGVHEAWAELVFANAADSGFGQSPGAGGGSAIGSGGSSAVGAGGGSAIGSGGGSAVGAGGGSAVGSGAGSAVGSGGVQWFSVRIGRQELVYDDERLLGNLNWLQQARRHDAVVFKLRHMGWQVDAGAAFNQNTDAFNYNGTFYTPDNIPPYVKDSKGNLAPVPAGYVPLVNAAGLSARTGSPSLVIAPGTNGANQDYKSMQFLYAARQWHETRLAGLVFADEFGRYKLDSARNIAGADTGYVYGRHFNLPGVFTRVTTGLLLTTPLDGQAGHWRLQAGGYYQLGHDRDGAKLSAYTTTLGLSYTLRSLLLTAGWDYLSGNNAFSTSTTDHRFDPLYGTPHKFWGYMDYFYAGTGSAAGGLSNPFFKSRYTGRGGRFSLEVCYHYFRLAADQKDAKGNAVDKYLGSEVDGIASYRLNKITGVEAGLCGLWASNSMDYAKGIAAGTARHNATWAYLQIDIKPDFLTK